MYSNHNQVQPNTAAAYTHSTVQAVQVCTRVPAAAVRTYMYSYAAGRVTECTYSAVKCTRYLQLGEGLAGDHHGMLEVFDDEDQLPATS